MDNKLTKAQGSVLAFVQERQDGGAPPPTVREICERFGYRSTRSATDHLRALQRKGFLTRDQNCARGLRLPKQTSGIPLLGRISAGYPRSAEEFIEQQLPLNPKSYGILQRARAFALRVSGDSMIGKRLFDGDIVILERDVEPKNGNVVAALIDNETTLKTFALKGNKAWLHAENPKYPDIFPALDLQIQGVVRAVIRFFRQ